MPRLCKLTLENRKWFRQSQVEKMFTLYSLVVESVMAPLPQSNHSTLPHHGSAVMSSKQSLGKASTYSTILKSEVHKYTLTHAYSIIKNK